MRLAALHPLCFAEGHKKCPAQAGRSYGVPGAAKNTGGEALFDANRVNPARVGCLTI